MRIILVVIIISISIVLFSCGETPTPSPEPTSTIQPTSTNTPLPTSTPLPTGTPTPLSTFPVNELSNPAFDITDVQVNVTGEKVKALFYLVDVPSEMEFNRSGVAKYHQEYILEICIDTDNAKNTGNPYPNECYLGTDYSLSAMKFKFDGDSVTTSIEKGIQVNVWEWTKKGGNMLAEGNIVVDPESNTIELTGTVPGINDSSVFYYRSYDANPGGKVLEEKGQLSDRIHFE